MNRARPVAAALLVAIGGGTIAGCPAGDDPAPDPVLIDGSLRAVVAAETPEWADPDKAMVHALHAVPGDPRVHVELGGTMRAAVFQVRLDAGTVRRVSPSPDVVPALGAPGWTRFPSSVTPAPDGRIVVVEEDGIRILSDPAAVVRSAGADRLLDEAAHGAHGATDVLGSHLGNVRARDLRSPDGRRLVAALASADRRWEVPLGVLDLETGASLATELILDEAEGIRLDGCHWRDHDTFVIRVWDYRSAGSTWYACTVEDDGVACVPIAPPDGDRPHAELRGIVGGRVVFDGVMPGSERREAVVTIGSWRLDSPEGRVPRPVLRGGDDTWALFVGDEIAGGERVGTWLAIVELDGPDGEPRATWIDVATIAGGELLAGEPGRVGVRDAVPDPMGEGGDAWLLLHERHGLLRLSRVAEAAEWRLAVVMLRPSGVTGSPAAVGQ
jgi:hypothetical protein